MIERLLRAAAGSEADMLQLIQQFDPLLHKYANKLSYEDAYYDLRYEFIRVIYNIASKEIDNLQDKYLVSYIHKSLMRAYYRLANKNREHSKNCSFADLTERQQYYLAAKLSSEDEYEQLLKDDLSACLTPREYLVIIKVVVCGLSSAAVAKEFGVSKQSINQTKKRALAKLKKAYPAKR